MSYTPTTWNTGDTITPSALNKIENGIADAGGGGVASVRISASGFNSSSHSFGYIINAYRVNGDWVVNSDQATDWHEFFGYTEPHERLVNVLVPSDTDVGVFLLDTTVGVPNITGGIDTTADTLYLSFGSPVLGNAYKITGNGSFEFVPD